MGLPKRRNGSMQSRIQAALFQAASSRHTGTSTFNLAAVNPAVQFSLLVMMYIPIFPIAISIRASNTYEEKSLGIYGLKEDIDESKGTTYVMMHMQNQLAFDLWYIFRGFFCICIAEADKIVDLDNPVHISINPGNAKHMTLKIIPGLLRLPVLL
jgi:Trk-type K+ transport system membrane component